MRAKLKRRSILSSGLRVSAAVAGFLCLALILAYADTDIWSASRSFSDHRKEAELAGLFSRIDQIRPLYEVAESENGADLVFRSKIPQVDGIEKFSDAQMANLIKSSEPLLQSLEAAAKRKHILFPHDRDNPYNFASSLSNLNGWIRMLCDFTRFSVKKGNVNQTRRFVRLASVLTMRTEEDRTIVATLTRASCAQLIFAKLRDILESKGRDPRWLAITSEASEILDQPYNFKLALNLQHFTDVAFIDDLERDPMTIKEGLDSGEFPFPIRFSRFLPRFYDSARARIHERYAGMFRLMSNDPYDFDSFDRACEFADRFMRETGWSYAGVRTVGQDLSQIALALRKETAIRNTVMQAIEFLKSGKKANGLPLIDRHALDFDGRPIRIVKNNHAQVIYTVWQDGIDNHGAPITKGQGDWSVRLPN